jgi:hypothetical protein
VGGGGLALTAGIVRVRANSRSIAGSCAFRHTRSSRSSAFVLAARALHRGRRMTTLTGYEMTAPGAPLRRASRTNDTLAPGQALVQVAGCGICHTDLGFLDQGVRTRHALPLILGHEISGVVRAAGPVRTRWSGRRWWYQR